MCFHPKGIRQRIDRTMFAVVLFILLLVLFVTFTICNRQILDCLKPIHFYLLFRSYWMSQRAVVRRKLRWRNHDEGGSEMVTWRVIANKFYYFYRNELHSYCIEITFVRCFFSNVFRPPSWEKHKIRLEWKSRVHQITMEMKQFHSVIQTNHFVTR